MSEQNEKDGSQKTWYAMKDDELMGESETMQLFEIGVVGSLVMIDATGEPLQSS